MRNEKEKGDWDMERYGAREKKKTCDLLILSLKEWSILKISKNYWKNIEESIKFNKIWYQCKLIFFNLLINFKKYKWSFYINIKF